MTLSKPIDVVRGIYDAFGRGDIESILAQLHPEVTWTCHFDPIVPWGGVRRGIDGAADFFRSIDEHVEVLGFEPKDHITEGDTVVSTGTFSCRSKRIGKEATTDWVFIWKLRDGKVISYEQFHDAAITDVFRD